MRAAFRTLASCILLLTVISPPLAAAAEWTTAASEHFEVFTTGGPGRARDALLYFERVHAFFGEVLKLVPAQSEKTQLLIFSNEREYRHMRPNESAIAYYGEGFDHRDYIVMQSLTEEAFPTVVHEYMHLLVRHSGSAFPIWLNEGLAEFYSTVTPLAGKMMVGRVPIDRLRHLNSSEALMPLERLFLVGHDSPEYNSARHAGLFYSQSWALTHMLLADERYRGHAVEFLAKSATGVPSADALEAAYGKTLDEVFRDLRRYVRADRFTTFVADYRDSKVDDVYATRADADFEATLAMGTLLAGRPERIEDARTMFRDLASLRPDDRHLAETMAYFELFQGTHANAVSAFARAVALGSDNAGLYRDYAAVVDDEQTRVSLLLKALDLAPSDIDIRLRCANALLDANRAPLARATLVAIQRVPPSQAFMYFQLLAVADGRTQLVDEALAAATRARSYAKTAREVEHADQLIQSIRVYEARLAGAESNSALDRLVRNQASGDSLRIDAVGASSGAPGKPGEDTQPARADAASESEIVASGTIVNIVCGTPPIMEVTIAGRRLRLLVDRPGRILPAGSAERDFACGPQTAAGRIGYAVTGKPTNVDGLLRLLDVE